MSANPRHQMRRAIVRAFFTGESKRARDVMAALGTTRFIVGMQDGEWLATICERGNVAHAGGFGPTPSAALAACLESAEEVAEARRTAP